MAPRAAARRRLGWPPSSAAPIARRRSGRAPTTKPAIVAIRAAWRGLRRIRVTICAVSSAPAPARPPAAWSAGGADGAGRRAHEQRGEREQDQAGDQARERRLARSRMSSARWSASTSWTKAAIDQDQREREQRERQAEPREARSLQAEQHRRSRRTATARAQRRSNSRPSTSPTANAIARLTSGRSSIRSSTARRLSRPLALDVVRDPVDALLQGLDLGLGAAGGRALDPVEDRRRGPCAERRGPSVIASTSDLRSRSILLSVLVVVSAMLASSARPSFRSRMVARKTFEFNSQGSSRRRHDTHVGASPSEAMGRRALLLTTARAVRDK